MSGSNAFSGQHPNVDKTEGKASSYECNICFDSANDPVVTLCGHLFCWPCLHQWLESRSSNPTCPVCKSFIDREKIIPVYSRGSTNKDPRNQAPPRPHGHRTDPGTNVPLNNNWFGNTNIQMGFGIAAFPFGLFATTPMNTATTGGSTTQHQDQTLSNIFLFAAIILIIWLILF